MEPIKALFQSLQTPLSESAEEEDKVLQVITYPQPKKVSKVLAVSEDPSVYHPLTGVEIEVAYPSSVFDIRTSLDRLRAIGAIKNEPVYNRTPIKEAVKDILNTIQYLSKPVLKEHEGLEIPYLPMSHKAHHAFFKEYKRALDLFSLFKFDPDIQGYSIQLNIDKKILGSNIKEQKETYVKFFWFLYKNRDLMCRLSRRRHEASFRGDILSLLNDKYGNLSEKELEKVFIKEKDGAIKALENGLLDPLGTDKAHYTMGTYTNKAGRESFEWGIFHTSLDINYLMAIIDLSFGLFAWLRITPLKEVYNFQNFYNYVISRKEYPYLLRHLTSNEVYRLMKKYSPK